MATTPKSFVDKPLRDLGRRKKFPALSSPPLPAEMPANRAHLCAWLSVLFGRDAHERAKYRIDSVACRYS